MESSHNQLERVRKPRIHIKYEVETEGATTQKELPFVAGVMGDFSGDSPGTVVAPLKDRQFVTIDRDNFNDVMKKISPGTQFNVNNTLTEETTDMSITLIFESMEDFEPAKVVDQIPALRKLKQARNKLRDLLSKTDRSDDLEKILEQTLQNNPSLQQLVAELDTINHQEPTDV